MPPTYTKRQILSLYKNILRVHEKLPYEIRAFGDMYVRVEFRRHKDCDPKFVPDFMTEWDKYLKQTKLAVDGHRVLGQELKYDDVEGMDQTQMEQLIELAEETKKSHYQFMVVDEDDEIEKMAAAAGGKSTSKRKSGGIEEIKRPGDY